MDIKPVLGRGLPAEVLKILEKALSDYNDISNEKDAATADQSLENQSEGNDLGPDQVT